MIAKASPKILKQLFHEEVELHGAILTEKAIQIVKEWLTQKRETENEHSFIPSRFWQGTIDELLEELDQ